MRFMSIKISVAALWYLPWKVGLTRSGSGRGHWRVLEVLDNDHDGKNGGEGTEVPGRSPSKEMTLEQTIEWIDFQSGDGDDDIPGTEMAQMRTKA